MSQREAVIEREAARSAGTGDMRLEVVVIPVSDVERAKRFYGGLGWRVDADFVMGDAFRVVQFTPPGSPCSIHFGTGVTSAVPGSAAGLYVIVPDIEAARTDLVRRGVDVSEVSRSGKTASHRSAPGAGQLLLFRDVQRSRRQRMAAAGGHRPAAGPRRLERDDLCLRIGSGGRDAARFGCPRRARDAHGRPAR